MKLFSSASAVPATLMLLISAVTLLVPYSASAQLSTVHINATFPTPVTTFGDTRYVYDSEGDSQINGGGTADVFMHVFWPQLTNDFIHYGISNFNSLSNNEPYTDVDRNSPQANEGTDLFQRGDSSCTNGNCNDDIHSVNQATLDRACSFVNASSQPLASSISTNDTWQGTNEHGRIVFFNTDSNIDNGTTQLNWNTRNANDDHYCPDTDISCDHALNTLSCVTTNLPDQFFDADAATRGKGYKINAGDSVTLSYDDTKSPSYSPTIVASVDYNANYAATAGSADSCTATGFSLNPAPTCHPATFLATCEQFDYPFGHVLTSGDSCADIQCDEVLPGSTQITCSLLNPYYCTAGLTGSVTVKPTTTTTYTYACTNSEGTTKKSVTVTVVPVNKPNLTATTFTVSPSAPVANSPATFTATIKNTGAAATGVAFKDQLYQCTNSSCASKNPIGSPNPYSNPALNAGQTTTPTPSFTYTFPSSGTYYLQICADSGNAVTNETSESDNCTPGQSVIVSPPLPDLTVQAFSPQSSLTAGPTTFTATILNDGDATAASSFTDTLYHYTNSTCTAGTSTAAYVTHNNPNLGVNKSLTDNFATTTYPGTLYLRVVTDSGRALQESNEGNNYSPCHTVTVNASPLPDLTPTPGDDQVKITSSVFTSDKPITFQASISNIGEKTTGGSFYNLLQRTADENCVSNPDSCTGMKYDVTYVLMGPLNVGSQATANFSSPIPAGTWYFRVCADKKSSSDTGLITESNESNNCGPWGPTSYTVYDPFSVTLSHGSSPLYGYNFTWTAKIQGSPPNPTYSWTSTTNTLTPPNDTSNTAQSTAVSGSNSATVTVTSSDGEKESATDTFNVSVPSCSLFTASPSEVDVGDPITVKWSCQNATSCIGTNFNTSGFSSNPTGVTVTAPNQSSISFQITCNGYEMPAPYPTVTIDPPEAFVTPSPDLVHPGDQISVEYWGTNSDSCTLTSSPSVVSDTSDGSPKTLPVTIEAQTTFTAVCHSGPPDPEGADSTKTATVNVTPNFTEF